MVSRQEQRRLQREAAANSTEQTIADRIGDSINDAIEVVGDTLSEIGDSISSTDAYIATGDAIGGVVDGALEIGEDAAFSVATTSWANGFLPASLENMVDSNLGQTLIDKHPEDLRQIYKSDDPQQAFSNKLMEDASFRGTLIDASIDNGMVDAKTFFSGLQNDLSQEMDALEASRGRQSTGQASRNNGGEDASINERQAELKPQIEMLESVNDLLDNKIVNNLAKSPEEMKAFLNDAATKASDGDLSDADLDALREKHPGFIENIAEQVINDPASAQEAANIVLAGATVANTLGSLDDSTLEGISDSIDAATNVFSQITAFDAVLDLAAKGEGSHLEAGQQFTKMMADQYPNNPMVADNLKALQGNEELMMSVGADLGAHGAELKQLLPGLAMQDPGAIEQLVSKHPDLIDAAVPIVAAGDPEMALGMATQGMEQALLATLGDLPDAEKAAATKEIKEFTEKMGGNEEFQTSMLEKLQDPAQASTLMENMRDLESLAGDSVGYESVQMIMEDMGKNPDEVLDVLASENFKSQAVYRWGDAMVSGMATDKLFGGMDDMLDNLANSQIGQMFPGLVDMLADFLPQLQQMVGGIVGDVSNKMLDGADYMAAGNGLQGALGNALGGFGGAGTLTMGNGIESMSGHVTGYVNDVEHMADMHQEFMEANYIRTDIDSKGNEISIYDTEAVDKQMRDYKENFEEVQNAPQVVDAETGRVSDPVQVGAPIARQQPNLQQVAGMDAPKTPDEIMLGA